MDKHLNELELRYQKLLLSGDFESLSPDEKEFIRTHFSEEDFNLERLIVSNADAVYDEDEFPVPGALIIPESSSGSVLMHSIPVYKALLAVAATIILMLLVFSDFNGTEIDKSPNYNFITKTDTVEREVVKWDTVIQTVEKPVYIEKTIYVEAPQKIKEEPRLLDVKAGVDIPELTHHSVNSAGVSLKDDEISTLISAFPQGD